MAAPTVSATVPSNAATGVDPLADITCTFDQAMRYYRDTPASETMVFTIYDSASNLVFRDNFGADPIFTDSHGNPVIGALTYSTIENKIRVKVNHIGGLIPGMTYTCTVSGAKNASGTAMSSPYTWSFTTSGSYQPRKYVQSNMTFSGVSRLPGSILKRAYSNFAGVGSAEILSGPPVEGYSLWIDAGSLSLSNNDPVPSWPDSSTNGNNLTAGTNKPTFKTNIQNGLPGVLFASASSTYFTGSLSSTQPYTVFLVLLPTIANPDQYVLDGNSVLQGSISFYVTGSALRAYAGSSFDVSMADILHPWIIGVLFDGSSSIISVNGSETTGNPGPGSTTGLTLGCAGSLTGHYDGYIFELIIYESSLTPTERSNVVGYLNSKYAIF